MTAPPVARPAPHTLGTFKSFHHVILANEELWDGEPNCTASVLLDTFARVFGTVRPPLTAGRLMTFWEADVAGAPLFPAGVKMFVADAAELFGTPGGAALRALCTKWGWVLAWALRDAPAGTSLELLSRRIVDPSVVRHTTANATVAHAAAAAFEAQWAGANATRRAGGPAALWAALWTATPARLRLGVMRAGLCADVGLGPPGVFRCPSRFPQ